MKQSDDNKIVPMTSVNSGKDFELRSDVHYFTNQIVNVIFVGEPKSNNWVLVDAGMPKSAKEIIKVARERFGENNRPSAIILTHGHFDHVGSIVDLVKEWNVPVFAHKAEFPYLTGREDYPEPDPTVQGGLLAKLSAYYPHEAINIVEVLQELPEDHSVPYLSGWKWIHTPGHSPGHVSFFRESDRTLIAGDAFVTVKADKFYKVLVQKKEINGPPVYLTTDWKAAKDSVKKLADLCPSYAVTGHGEAIEGEELAQGLKKLSEEFDDLAVPDHGKYVHKD